MIETVIHDCKIFIFKHSVTLMLYGIMISDFDFRILGCCGDSHTLRMAFQRSFPEYFCEVQNVGTGTNTALFTYVFPTI